MSKGRAIWRTWAAIVAGIALAGAAYGYWKASWRSFDSARWANARYRNERATMYNDLVRGHLNERMSRAQIERKLGKADHEEDSSLVYFSGNSPSLQTGLDARGRYSGFELIGSD